MGAHPKIFNKLYVNMIRAGEASGALDKVLNRLADFTEYQARLKSKIQSAMMHPAIMMVMGGVIMLVMFVVVIPRITKIFTQVNAELPLQTTALIFTADIVKNYWYLLFILAVLAVWGFENGKAPRLAADLGPLHLRAPIFGTVVEWSPSLAFQERWHSFALRRTCPYRLRYHQEVLNNTRLADVVSEARDAIREGESVAEPLKKSGEFPPIVVHMIATGEKSGQLEEMLENVAENHDFQVDQKVESLTTLIEPIMIVALGVGVAYVVWAVLLYLQLSQHVRG